MYQLMVTAYVSLPGSGVACDTTILKFRWECDADRTADELEKKDGEVRYSVVKIYE